MTPPDDLIPPCSIDRSRQRGSDVAVLMSTYARDCPDALREALESLYAQTETPDRIVIVIDGEVSGAHHAVIDAYATDGRGPRLTRVALPGNGGLARALNAGLPFCDGRYVMRMDSDDVCLPDRLALQHAYLEAHPDIDLCSSWSSEFVTGGADERIKVSPTEHSALASALRWRNVLAHSAIMVRTEALKRIGGYRAEFGLLEDYDLYVRLLSSGARFHVIPKILLRVRTSLAQRARRGNFTYALKEIRFRRECFRAGFLTFSQFLATAALYAGFRLAGPVLRNRLYALSRS